jgi:ribonuclease Z
MPASFTPRLVNDPFGDPGLFIPFRFQGRAFFFDLGDAPTISNRELLKVSHAFVTHTHVDHFIGFDRMLRVLLGRGKRLCLFGPEGFLDNLTGKLRGYTWNLVDTGAYPLVIEATEVRPDRALSRTLECRQRFADSGEPQEAVFDGTLLAESALTVSGAILDHEISCLGLALTERFHVNILVDRVRALGAAPGPWLSRFKEALYEKQPPESFFEVPLEAGGRLSMPLSELTDAIARISAGRKIGYVTDVAYTDDNVERIVSLARNADHLFIEAGFLHEDRGIAREKSHLTARQAGRIARRCSARKMTIFHFSPRYQGRENQLYREAEAAFAGE